MKNENKKWIHYLFNSDEGQFIVDAHNESEMWEIIGQMGEVDDIEYEGILSEAEFQMCDLDVY